MDTQPQPAQPHLEHGTPGTTLLTRVEAAAELLESIMADRDILRELPAETRERLMRAVGEVHCPDLKARKGIFKARQREHKARKLQGDDLVLNQTGIRALRSKPVFVTPNLIAPGEDFAQREIEGEPDFREVLEPQNCYICKRDYSRIHHFYDQLCLARAEFKSPQALRIG